MVQGIHGVLSFAMTVFAVLPTMTHTMRVTRQEREVEARALAMYRPARDEFMETFKIAQSSDLSELCAAASVYGRMNKTANIADLPGELWSLVSRRRLPVFVPVYARPNVRFISRFQHFNTHSALSSCTVTSVAVLARISLSSPRKYVYLLSKNVFLGSKYPKNT